MKSKTKWKGSREIRNKIKFQFTHVALQLILPLMVLFRSLFFRTDTLPPPLLTPFTPVSFTSLFSHSHSVRCNYSDQFNLALKCGYFMLPLTLERDGFFDLQSCWFSKPLLFHLSHLLVLPLSRVNSLFFFLQITKKWKTYTINRFILIQDYFLQKCFLIIICLFSDKMLGFLLWLYFTITLTYWNI